MVLTGVLLLVNVVGVVVGYSRRWDCEVNNPEGEVVCSASIGGPGV